ncbi:hypothetical protein KR074_002764, partial [Drosophila pseudoananassae]
SDKTALNSATKRLTKLLQRLRTCAFEEYLRQVEPGDPEPNLWQLTSHIKRPKKRVAQVRKPDGEWCRSDQERADAFAGHLEDAFTPFNRCSEVDQAETERFLSLPCTDFCQLEPVSEEKVQEEVAGLNTKKSPGADGLEALAIKLLPPLGIQRLTSIFNACLEIGHFPSDWKKAEVILIPKPGKPEADLASYSPISLLSVLSNLEEKKYCCAVFLDAKQAFDMVWHPGLLMKIKRSVPHEHYAFLKSYLNDRSFRVGQGSVLGPNLYTIYTADMPV